MNLNKFILFFLCIGLLSCGDDELGGIIVENADVELRLASKFAGESFFVSKPGQLERPFPFEGKTLKFTDFNFFLSNFALFIKQSEDNITLDEIEYFNPSLFDTEVAANKGVPVNLGRVPIATLYDKLFFGFGVSPDLNGSRPSEYGGNHPLSNSDLYLEDINSYISLKLEGEVDHDNDGTFDDIFAFNLILDAAYGEITVDIPDFEVFTDTENILNLELDVQTLLQNVDFDGQLTTSETQFDNLMAILKQNFSTALTVK